MSGNYPDGTWGGDPRAPWNRQDPPRRCDRCAEWRECPCGCGEGWCSELSEFTAPDPTDECDAFDGETEEYDDPRIDQVREEGWIR